MSDEPTRMFGYKIPPTPSTFQDFAAAIDGVSGAAMPPEMASLLKVMASAANFKTGENIEIGIPLLAARTKMSEGTCRKYRRLAVELGVLVEVRTSNGGYTKDGRGLVPTYQIVYKAIMALPTHEYGPPRAGDVSNHARCYGTTAPCATRRDPLRPAEGPPAPHAGSPCASRSQPSPTSSQSPAPTGGGGGSSVGWNRDAEAALLAFGVSPKGARRLATNATSADVYAAMAWVRAKGSAVDRPAGMLVSALETRSYLSLDDPARLSDDDLLKFAWLRFQRLPLERRTEERVRSLSEGDAAGIRADPYFMKQIVYEAEHARKNPRRTG